MSIVYYNAVLDSFFVLDSDEESSLIYWYAVAYKDISKTWVCLGEL